MGFWDKQNKKMLDICRFLLVSEHKLQSTVFKGIMTLKQWIAFEVMMHKIMQLYRENISENLSFKDHLLILFQDYSCVLFKSSQYYLHLIKYVSFKLPVLLLGQIKSDCVSIYLAVGHSFYLC